MSIVDSLDVYVAKNSNNNKISHIPNNNENDKYQYNILNTEISYLNKKIETLMDALNKPNLNQQ